MDEHRDKISLKPKPTDGVQAKREGCKCFEDVKALNVMMLKEIYYFLPAFKSNFITSKHIF